MSKDEPVKIDMKDVRDALHITTTEDDMQSMMSYAYTVYMNAHTDDSMYFTLENIAMTTVRYIVDHDTPSNPLRSYMKTHKAHGIAYAFHVTERSDEYARYLTDIGISPYSDKVYVEPHESIISHFNDVAILSGLDPETVVFNVRKSLLANDDTLTRNLLILSAFSNVSSDINTTFIAAMGLDTEVSPWDREQWNVTRTATITAMVREWMRKGFKAARMDKYSDSDVIDMISFVYTSTICLLQSRHWDTARDDDLSTAVTMIDGMFTEHEPSELLLQVRDFLARGVSPSDKAAMDSISTALRSTEARS